MAEDGVPVQPLPDWMSRTWLQLGPSSSTYVTLVFPQTYSGPAPPGLTWPWVPAAQGTDGGVQVSIVGGDGGFTRLGGSAADSTAGGATATPPGSNSARPGNSSTGATVTSPVPSQPSASQSRPTAAGSSVATNSPSRGSSLTTTTPSSSSSPPSSFSSSTTISSSSSSPTVTPTTSSPASGSSSPSSSSSTTSSASPSQSNAGMSLSSGVIVAIVIAATGLFLLIGFLLGTCLIRRYKRRHHSQEEAYTDGRSGPPRNMAYRNSPDPAAARNQPSGGFAAVSERRGSDAEETENLMAYRDDNIPDRRAYNTGTEMDTGATNPRVRQTSASTSQTYPSLSTKQSDTTTFRGTLISQFPTYKRQPSDGSGGPGGANGTGDGPGPSTGGRGADQSRDAQPPASPGTMAEDDLFYSPPARPPSDRRTIPISAIPVGIGLGRPSSSIRVVNRPRRSSTATTAESTYSSDVYSSPSLAPFAQRASTNTTSTGTDVETERSSRVFDTRSATGGSAVTTATSLSSMPPSSPTANPQQKFTLRVAPRTSTIQERGSSSTPFEEYEDELSDRDEGETSRAGSESTGLGGWLKGIGFLRPYLSTPDRSGVASDEEKGGMKEMEGGHLLPSTVAVARNDPAYRRVTTTAAAFSTQDLLDLARHGNVERQEESAPMPPLSRPRSGNSVSDGHHSQEADEDDEAGNVHEGTSFLRSPSGPSTAHSGLVAAKLKDDPTKRWSRATLGQPIRRLSGFSTLSLADARSISESIVSASVKSRSRSSSNSNSRSRSGSVSDHTTRSEKLLANLQRMNSNGSSSHDVLAPSTIASRSNSASTNSSRGKGKRRKENSSGGSSSTSGTGSIGRRSNRSEISLLRRVTEGAEVPPLPLGRSSPTSQDV